MSFFEKVVKGVSKGVDRAQFEAQKMLRIQSLKGEIARLKEEQAGIVKQIGEKALALHQTGDLTFPGLEELAQKWKELETKLGEKEKELAAVQAEEFKG